MNDHPLDSLFIALAPYLTPSIGAALNDAVEVFSILEARNILLEAVYEAASSFPGMDCDSDDAYRWWIKMRAALDCAKENKNVR